MLHSLKIAAATGGRGIIIPKEANATFAFSGWSKTNVTLTENAAVAPNGATEATKVEATASAATQLFLDVAGIGSANGNIYRIYLKRGSADTATNRFILRNQTTAANLHSLVVNHATRAITSGTGTVDLLHDGWYRLNIAATSGISDGDTIRIYGGFIGNAETAAEHCFAWNPEIIAL